MESRFYLDTHVLVWLLGEQFERLSRPALAALGGAAEILISPMVRLELQVLYEIGRLTYSAERVLAEAGSQLGVRVPDHRFDLVAQRASDLSWTRDPFDRLIVAQAGLDEAPLVTKDRRIREHYPRAVW